MTSLHGADHQAAGQDSISQSIANAIVDPIAYENGSVDAAFAAIRAVPGLSWVQPDDYSPFWVVSRHADIMAIEKRADVFLNGPRSSTISPAASEMAVKFLTGGEANLIRSLVAVDGAEHKALRAVTFPAMTPPEDIAFWFPLRVIMRVLGVPQEDEKYLMQLTQELFSPGDPELNRIKKEVTPAEALQLLVQTNADLEAYFAEVTKKFRAAPDDAKVNSLIANARIEGEYLSHRQIMGYYIIAATAGHDTTSNATAAAMWALAERPDLLSTLQAEPELIAAFVEESIRWATPVKHFMRTAAEDTEYEGQAIKAGDWLMLSYHSANQDESAFDAPGEFRLDRKPNKQVAFGYGPHVCLGQHLARLEMRLLWEALIPRLGTLTLSGAPERTRSSFVCGPKHVPIRFTLKD
ncbi:MAG: cytochrome P450 [Sphingopyxis sp.]|nr:cytochrome P450 [Sphingopyxis sp.]